jgi:hypothetical protein
MLHEAWAMPNQTRQNRSEHQSKGPVATLRSQFEQATLVSHATVYAKVTIP